jgi:hypothetical protein
MTHFTPHRWNVAGWMAAVALAAVGWTEQAAAQSPYGQRMVLMQAVRGSWMQFNIVSGRIQVTSTQFINVSNGPEKLAIRPDGNQSTVEYEANLADETLHFSVRDTSRLQIHRATRGPSKGVSVEFLQTPSQPLTLTVRGEGQPKVYRADGLWQLLVVEPEVSRQHLTPLLELLRPEWRLADKASEVEEELLQSAASGKLPDRQRWEALVKQLADDRFARREAADRELRAAGPAVIPFLERLDFAHLEAEQQARVRRILSELSQDIDDDTVPQIAVGLAAEAPVWLGLMSRPEECTRRLAANQLALLLGGPVDFNPAAGAAVRQTQIERLRTRVAPR